MMKSSFRTGGFEESDFYNPINYPNLPYDKLTCEHLCVSQHYKDSCGCLMYAEMLHYAGVNETWEPCVTYNEGNCSQSYAYRKVSSNFSEKIEREK